ncbi:MAG TPA: ribonuclease HII [Oscillospiraceae bacterium]|nr:ribonuclease HII [Oscillospiraceae bacterium]
MSNFTKMTVAQIRRYFKETVPTPAELAQLSADQRVGVRHVVQSYLHQLEAQRLEKERLSALHKFERKARLAGYTYIAGVDEAGRGPLAGPVVAAAVILPENFSVTGLNDSKKVSPLNREKLYTIITKNAIAWSVGAGQVAEIDQYNILNATKMAMRRAILGLTTKPDYVLLDALELEDLPYPQQGIIGGDGLSASIAAASIIAKVTRDRLMCELAELLPGYGFAEHKGYPTREHRKAIAQLGATPFHRQSFMLLPAEEER